MKHHRNGLFMLVFALLASCSTPRAPRGSWQTQQAREVQADLKVWKSDRLGCRGERIEAAALRILEAFKSSKGVSQNQIEFNLGRSEYKQTRNGMRVLGYYFDTDCTNSEIVEGSVYCVLEFYLNSSDQLSDGTVVCG